MAKPKPARGRSELIDQQARGPAWGRAAPIQAAAAGPGARPRDGGDLLDVIGNTPLLRIRLPELPESVELWAKAEWFNPGGSVKDRAAKWIVLAAEAEGSLPSKRLLDASSGNTAIAYAMLGAARGFGVTVCLPANASRERKLLLAAYGAEVIETSALEGSDGAILEARRRHAERPDLYYYADQYNNPANPRAHYESTGPEIWEESQGRVTHFVAGLGTTGTFTGAGRRLRERNPDIELIAVEPDSGFHAIEGLKHLPSAVVPGIYDPDLATRTVRVRTEDAYAMAQRIARELGLLVGPSSGAAAWAAAEVGKRLRSGVVVTIFPDGGDRYLSTALWEAERRR